MIDYKALLKGSVVIITGAGRSGTSLLGKLVGSMSGAIYLFEPAVFKIGFGGDWDRARAVFFEDYILPTLQGRALNCDHEQQSYYKNYFDNDVLSFRYGALSSRKSAIEWIENTRPLVVVKANELTSRETVEEIFPEVRVIHIVRNGLAVISSSMEREWYTDEYCDSMMDGKFSSVFGNAPIFLDPEAIQNWKKYNQTTRCAAVWRSLVNRREEWDYLVQYEDLCADPSGVTEDLATDLATDLGNMTSSHIVSITGRKLREVDWEILEQIQPPEREAFERTMEELGYEL